LELFKRNRDHTSVLSLFYRNEQINHFAKKIKTKTKKDLQNYILKVFFIHFFSDKKIILETKFSLHILLLSQFE
jgi:hypothetical protein